MSKYCRLSLRESSVIQSRLSLRESSVFALRKLLQTKEHSWRQSPHAQTHFRGKALIFSELGLIFPSEHDLIPCMASAFWTHAVPVLHEERHGTSSF